MRPHPLLAQTMSLIPLAVPLLLAACGEETATAPPGGAPAGVEPGQTDDPAVPGQRHLTEIGLQLYTVRTEMERDFEGTLRAIAGMGYSEVEFAGLFGHEPGEVRQLLTELNLIPVGSHVTWDRFRDDPDAAIEETLELGCQYIVFPWLPDSERQTLEQWQGWVELLNRVGQSSDERGIQLAYHNHDFEFAPIDGVVPYDLLLDELDRSVVSMELDLYWVAKAGADPAVLFERAPGDFPLGHIKDMRASDQGFADVGQGELDFAAVFALAGQAGMQHFIVEHDEPADPMQSVQNSFSYLQQLSF
jgi:sugar phosphate isomerase/epimerase